jgi:hypothetical protein
LIRPVHELRRLVAVDHLDAKRLANVVQNAAVALHPELDVKCVAWADANSLVRALECLGAWPQTD